MPALYKSTAGVHYPVKSSSDHRGPASKILVYFSAMGGWGGHLESLAAKLDF